MSKVSSRLFNDSVILFSDDTDIEIHRDEIEKAVHIIESNLHEFRRITSVCTRPFTLSRDRDLVYQLTRNNETSGLLYTQKNGEEIVSLLRKAAADLENQRLEYQHVGD